jgi:hypothetical protein
MAVIEPQKNGIGRFLHALIARKLPTFANISAFIAASDMDKFFFDSPFCGVALKDRLCRKHCAALAFGGMPTSKLREPFQTCVAQTDWLCVSL